MRTGGLFSAHDGQLLSTIATEAAVTLRHSELHSQLLLAEAQYAQLAGLVGDRTHETVAQRLRRSGEQLAERIPCGQLCLLRLDTLAGTLQTRIRTPTLTLTLAVPSTLIVPLTPILTPTRHAADRLCHRRAY